jgi:hypothetical protein
VHHQTIVENNKNWNTSFWKRKIYVIGGPIIADIPEFMSDTRISQVLNEHQIGQKQNNNQSKSRNVFQLIFI